MGYIDTHAHYLSKQYNKDRKEVLNSVFNNGVSAIIECGTDEYYNKKILDFTKQFDNVYGLIGFDPVHLDGLSDNVLNNFIEMLKDKKIVGIGEIGLDYYRADKDKWKEQEKWFRYQLDIARKYDLPVCIHSRDAKDDTLRILKDFGEYKGVIHCFSYDIESMKELVKLGYSFGVGGTSTYKNNVSVIEAIKEMPLDRIVLETDAPYLSPTEVRGTRNQSDNIKYVISNLSRLLGVLKEEIIEITRENSLRLYNKIKIGSNPIRNSIVPQY